MATASRPPSSPSSSPRLPSPPPMAEDQTKPHSPRPGATHQTIPASRSLDTSGARRIRPGTKAADIAEGPPLVDISEIDSPFQLTEHLKALHYSFIHPSGSHTTHPLDASHASQLASPPQGIDKYLWLYELCRFLVQKLNKVIVALFNDKCCSDTCPEMRASEWQYLCAVHNPPKPCCAIDYCCHTLDWAANSLTSPKDFPSRLSLGSEGSTTGNVQVRTITNIMRRVYRILAHAWFSHRDMFWKVENETGLYICFKTVCDAYALIPEDNYTIPPEAEGVETPQEDDQSRTQQPAGPTSILKRTETRQPTDSDDSSGSTSALATPGATARRHRHTPSKGAPVDTVPEEVEEEDVTLDTGSPPTQTSLKRSDTQLRTDDPYSTSSGTQPPPSSGLASVAPPSDPYSAPPPVIEERAASPLSPRPQPPSINTTSVSTKAFSPFSQFSPASPKAATFEEVEEMRSEQAKNESEAENAAKAEEAKEDAAKAEVEVEVKEEVAEEDEEKKEITEAEGKEAGGTGAKAEDEAGKSVED